MLCRYQRVDFLQKRTTYACKKASQTGCLWKTLQGLKYHLQLVYVCFCLCEPDQSNVKHFISGTFFFKYKNVKDAKAFKFRKESELFHSIYALFPDE